MTDLTPNRRRKNRVLLLVLVALAVTMYGITLIRFTHPGGY